MPDLPIKCQDCGQEFAWTEGEIEFYKEKGLSKPTYCPICRALHKAKKRQFAKNQRITEHLPIHSNHILYLER